MRDKPSTLFMTWSTPALRKAQDSSGSAVLAGMTAKASMMIVWEEDSTGKIQLNRRLVVCHDELPD